MVNFFLKMGEFKGPGSQDPYMDPHQNEMDPKRWSEAFIEDEHIRQWLRQMDRSSSMTTHTQCCDGTNQNEDTGGV